MTYLPVKARSECVDPSTFGPGGVVEISCMFQAAWPAVQSPADKPTRGSGLGVVAETIGLTGGGITAGGGGGGGGGVPRPRPAGAAAPGGVAAAAAVVEGAGAVAGVAGWGCAAADVVGGVAAAGAEAPVEEAGVAGEAFGPHPTATTRATVAVVASIVASCLDARFMTGAPLRSLTSASSDRFQRTDRRTRPTRTCRSAYPARHPRL